MNTPMQNLIKAVKHALDETEHFTIGNDVACLRLQKFDVPGGTFDWLGKAVKEVEVEQAGVITATAEPAMEFTGAFIHGGWAAQLTADIALLKLTTREQVARLCAIRFPNHRTGSGGRHVWVSANTGIVEENWQRIIIITGTGPDWL